tara:strand:- start:783 stop:1547 length:765 start_codon:yes stop_codon:yes gene_type:complete
MFFYRLNIIILFFFFLISKSFAESLFEKKNPFIFIKGGEFVFGNNRGEENEIPQTLVNIENFYINMYEISNEIFNDYVSLSGNRNSYFYEHFYLGKNTHPVVGLSWKDASDFCKFYNANLPTEAQYERATRGLNGNLYSWGNDEPNPKLVNMGSKECCNPDIKDGYEATSPVGSFPLGKNEEGVMDLTGNVWEWMDGWYYSYKNNNDQEKLFRVLRGGSWKNNAWKLRSTYRMAYNGDFRFAANGGFRCVKIIE